MDNIFYLGGTAFIRLMKMLVVPLVFCSIVVGVASISDIRQIGTIGGTTIVIYQIVQEYLDFFKSRMNCTKGY